MKTRYALIAASVILLGTWTGACRRAAAPEGASTEETGAAAVPPGTVVLTPEAMKGGGISVDAARSIRTVM